MTVIARLFSGVALGCVLASSLIAPVTGSLGSAVKHQHAQHAQHAKKAAHHNDESAALASRDKQENKRGKPSGNKGSGSVHNPVKAGLSWTNNWLDQRPFLEGASWCYNWGCSTDCSEPSGGEILYIPMFWCTKTIPNWEKYVMGKSWQAILGHNEPNIGGQCSLSPGTAVAQWKKYIEPVQAQVKASPAVTTGSQGLNWLKSFVAQCTGCQIDVIVIHHYALTAASFITQAEAFHAAFPNHPIWVTEIGCQDYSGHGQYCSNDMAWAMVAGVKAFIDATPWIQKWAWYQFAEETNIDSSNALMTSGGGITPLAKLFLGHS